MSKKFYILLLVVFGFFMTPSQAFACGTKTEKSCCSKKQSAQTEKGNCCKKNKKTNESSHNGCDGACKSISCSSIFNIEAPSLFFEELHQPLISSSEKQNYYYSEIFIPSDFRSIWLPPKIS